MRIQRLGDRRWIVLGDPPAQVWPLTKQFLADNGVGLGREDAAAGSVDSAWIVIADQEYGDVVRSAIRDGRAKHAEEAGEVVPAGRDRLRFRVERGIRRGSTEVHVVHQRAIGVDDTLADALPEVQAEVTAQLAEYYAAGVSGSVSMLGRDIASAHKAEIVKDDKGYPALHLRVDFDRAWATVNQALQRAEISAEGDLEDAVYDAVFPTAGDRGWLKRIVPGGEVGRDTPSAHPCGPRRLGDGNPRQRAGRQAAGGGVGGRGAGDPARVRGVVARRGKGATRSLSRRYL